MFSISSASIKPLSFQSWTANLCHGSAVAMLDQSTPRQPGGRARSIFCLFIFGTFVLLSSIELASAQRTFSQFGFDSFNHSTIDCTGNSSLTSLDPKGNSAISLSVPVNGNISGLCSYKNPIEFSEVYSFRTMFSFNGSRPLAEGSQHIIFFIAGGCDSASSVATSGCPGSLHVRDSILLLHFALSYSSGIHYYKSDIFLKYDHAFFGYNGHGKGNLGAPANRSLDKTFVWIQWYGTSDIFYALSVEPEMPDNGWEVFESDQREGTLFELFNSRAIMGFFESDIVGSFDAWTASANPSRINVWDWSFNTSVRVDFYTPLRTSHGRSYSVEVIIPTVFGAMLLMLGFFYFLYRRTAEGNDSLIETNQKLRDERTRLEDERTRLVAELNLLDFGAREFTYKELQEATDCFTNVIGKGGFGIVFKGTLQGVGIVAVKEIKRTEKNLDDAKQLVAEVQVIGRLRHVNIVPLHGWCYDREKRVMLLVYKFVDNADLDQHLFPENFSGYMTSFLADAAAGPLAWTKRMKALQGVAAALVFLHEEFESEETVIHRDIKPTNVMLDSEFNARLGDFGLARLSKRTEAGHQSGKLAGTFGYIAPEYPLEATTKTDVYSFGVLILVVATGRKPLDKSFSGHEGLVGWVRDLHDEGKVLEAGDANLYNGSDWSSQDYEQMKTVLKVGLYCCLYEPSKRPTMREALTALQGPPTMFLAPLPPQFPAPVEFSRLGNWSTTIETNVNASHSASLLKNSCDSRCVFGSESFNTSTNVVQSESQKLPSRAQGRRQDARDLHTV